MSTADNAAIISEISSGTGLTETIASGNLAQSVAVFSMYAGVLNQAAAAASSSECTTSKINNLQSLF